jgi:Txe/YoeB family toxin of Txe-Axe toxin-antitoxin module
MIKPSKVIFADEKLEKAFLGMDENDPLKKSIRKSIDRLKSNAFSGEPISKRLIPAEYTRKYHIDNLWIMDLSKEARLVYSVMTPNKVEILSVIIEYFDNHKDYEKRFKY